MVASVSLLPPSTGTLTIQVTLLLAGTVALSENPPAPSLPQLPPPPPPMHCHCTFATSKAALRVAAMATSAAAALPVLPSVAKEWRACAERADAGPAVAAGGRFA